MPPEEREQSTLLYNKNMKDVSRDIYDKISSLKDLQAYTASTSDGETSFLEFKSIPSNITTKGQKATLKATLAKELCAFANTDGGIICVGVKNNKGILQIDNKFSDNLCDFLDTNLVDVLEPKLSGYHFKTVKDDGNSFVILYIPNSRVKPHRVSSWKSVDGDKRDVLGRYFMRSGTESVPMPESLVRAMYLSDGRIPNVELYAEISEVTGSKIKITHMVKPDEYRFIDKHVISSDMRIAHLGWKEIPGSRLGSDFNLNDDGSIDIISNFINKQSIYPSSHNYPVNDFTIKSTPEEGEFESTPDSSFPHNISTALLAPKMTVPDMSNTEKEVSTQMLEACCVLYIETDFACEAVPLKCSKQLFYIGLRNDLLGRNEVVYRPQSFATIKDFLPQRYEDIKFYSVIPRDSEYFDKYIPLDKVVAFLDSITSSSSTS